MEKYDFIPNRRFCPSCYSSVLYPINVLICPRCGKPMFILADVVKKRLEELNDGKEKTV